MALLSFVESAPRAYRLKGATPTSSEIQQNPGHPPALCTFLLVFVLGISARRARIRKYAVSVGYAGALFSCAFLFPAYFGVAQVDEFEASMICVAVSILALALLELALRQLLRGFLYNPQP
jgi:hypothetical protein